ncbi:MAG TPA: hypothetical protein VGF67_30115 [Ktedonobacteraceae bacterium]|jgi:hypothetical protein
MAGKRCIPTDLFWDEIFSSLNGETQSIFLGLVLAADDHGRGLAGQRVLSRMLAKDLRTIEQALPDLEDGGFLQCYEVNGRHYYHITCWDEWETLHKPARSRYPEPPEVGRREKSGRSACAALPEPAGASRVFVDIPGDGGKISGEAEGRGGGEEKRREKAAAAEGRGEEEQECTAVAAADGGEREEQEERPQGAAPHRPDAVIPFPASARGSGERGKEGGTSPQELARILHLPLTPALDALVAEFEQVPELSLMGEAYAAQAWVDDQRGKRRDHLQMTLPLFRRWLQRSRQLYAAQAEQLARAPGQATGTEGSPGPRRLPSLMYLLDDLKSQKKLVRS